MDGQPILRCECGARIAIPVKLYGRKIPCPGCGKELEVPDYGSAGATGPMPVAEPPRPLPQTAPLTAVRVTKPSDATVPVPSVAPRDVEPTVPVPHVNAAAAGPAPAGVASPRPAAAPCRPPPVATPRPARNRVTGPAVLWLCGMGLTAGWVTAVLARGAGLAAVDRGPMGEAALCGLLGLAASAVVLWAQLRGAAWSRALSLAAALVAIAWNARDIAAAAMALEGAAIPGWAFGGVPFTGRGWLLYEVINGVARVALATVMLTLTARPRRAPT